MRNSILPQKNIKRQQLVEWRKWVWSQARTAQTHANMAQLSQLQSFRKQARDGLTSIKLPKEEKVCILKTRRNSKIFGAIWKKLVFPEWHENFEAFGISRYIKYKGGSSLLTLLIYLSTLSVSTSYWGSIVFCPPTATFIVSPSSHLLQLYDTIPGKNTSHSEHRCVEDCFLFWSPLTCHKISDLTKKWIAKICKTFRDHWAHKKYISLHAVNFLFVIAPYIFIQGPFPAFTYRSVFHGRRRHM